MELDFVKLFQDLGLSGGIGLCVFLIFKNYGEQIMRQNNEALQYLMDLNKELLKNNADISDKTRKALDDNTRIIHSLVEELKKKRE